MKAAIVAIILILSLVPALADTVRYYDYETGIELSQEESTGHKFIQSIYNSNGLETSRCLFDGDYHPMEDQYGVHLYVWTYDEFGKRASETCYNNDGAVIKPW